MLALWLAGVMSRDCFLDYGLKARLPFCQFRRFVVLWYDSVSHSFVLPTSRRGINEFVVSGPAELTLGVYVDEVV